VQLVDGFAEIVNGLPPVLIKTAWFCRDFPHFPLFLCLILFDDDPDLFVNGRVTTL
jgi:hypothetical protein